MPQGSPLRVAAYCRVSTDKEDQRNSLSAQRQFFQTYLAQNPGWTGAGIYADEGLSGTSASRRPQFTAMVRLALAGELDLIVTKEVSRFARNTVDALQVTRQLKERGVGVLFLSDGIDTRDNDGEFRLTIMASVAQEESRKISQRTRWGQLQAMKRGVVFGNSRVYGFTLQGGRLTPRPEEAEVVRLVYRKFLEEGKGTYVIARELTQAGIPAPLRAEGGWSSTMVLRLLRNEKYCGDLLQKKYFTTDHLSHRKVPNRGEEEQIYLKDHHQALIPRAQYQAVQAELERRGRMVQQGRRYSARYWYSGKIRCGQCGGTFALKRTRRPDGTEYQRFVCRGRGATSGGCQMRAVSGRLLSACVQRVYAALNLDREAILDAVLAQTPGLSPPCPDVAAQAGQLRQAIRRQCARRDRAQEAFLDGDLSREDVRRLTARCLQELERLNMELERLLAGPSAPPSQELRLKLSFELEGGEAVLDEIIEQVTVFEDCLHIRVAELPAPFRVCAQMQGRGEGSRVAVTQCALLAPAL